MPRFYLPASCLEDEVITVTGDDARHIAMSLRMTAGERLTLCDSQCNEYCCEIISVKSAAVSLRKLSHKASETEPPVHITLYQAIAKGEKMDYIVKKSVELGVCDIIPVVSERCIVRLDRELADKKVVRWRKIAAEAAGQCGRGIIPQVSEPVCFSDALAAMSAGGLSFVCYEGANAESLKSILPDDVNKTGGSISFLIGPEGGLSANEVEAAKRLGLPIAGLGKRILRTETASAFVLSVAGYMYEL